MPITIPNEINISSDVPTDARNRIDVALNYYANSGLYQDRLTDMNAALDFVASGKNYGEYNNKTKRIQIDSSQSVEEMLNTILHEGTHFLQDKAETQGTYGADRRNYFNRRYNVVGESSTSRIDKATDLRLNYGLNELAAFITANMRPGKQAKDSEAQKFIKQYPEFSSKYFSANTQPNRPEARHKKGYTEMNALEKVMFDLFNVAPDIER